MSTFSSDILESLKQRAGMLRIDSIRATTEAGSGHPTSALSAADLVAALFFHEMKLNPSDPFDLANDRFVLSKGHAVPVVYAAWKQLGVISDKELLSLRKFDSRLEGHPTPRFAYNEAATGSLGQGLSIACGMALAADLGKLPYTTYCMMGDGEIAEGSIWEAAAFAAKNDLSNLVGIVDCNRLGQSDESMYNHHMDLWAAKWKAFGWETKVIDGHNMSQILTALSSRDTSGDKPLMLLAKTYKGYGLEDRENKNGFHGKPLKPDEAAEAIKHLRTRFGLKAINETFKPEMRKMLPAEKLQAVSLKLATEPNKEKFELSQKYAPRKAFGDALAALGRESKKIIALDADVKNSTYTQTFEKEFPDRFVQCYIAEQNMVGVATGFELRGFIPFAATFGCFFTRAFDQIRMAGIGRNALRLCGSHCGVSIGEDGPSQMALEDLGMMRSIPHSIVFYPSDAVSTYKLTGLMANYHDGVSYLRTTRMDTEVLYSFDEEFKIGGSKVVLQSENDTACIVAAGVTLHEARKAAGHLAKDNISIAIIDAYSIKPLDVATITKMGQASGGRIIVVEDHYEAGGLGEAVATALCNSGLRVDRLFVKKLSRSGKPQQLLADAHIDAQAIIEAVTTRFCSRSHRNL